MGNYMNEAKKLDTSRLISIALTISPIASWLFAVFSPNLALAATKDDLKVHTSKLETTLTGSYANSSIGEAL